MTTTQPTITAPKVFPTPAKPPKKRPLPRVSSSASATNIPTQVICQNDAPILWVSKGALAEVSKRVKENISGTWEVRAEQSATLPDLVL